MSFSNYRTVEKGEIKKRFSGIKVNKYALPLRAIYA